MQKDLLLLNMENSSVVNSNMENISSVQMNNERTLKENQTSFLVFLITCCIIFIIGSTLNTILLIVFLRRPSFRVHLSNRFLINLVLVNLLTCIVWIPVVIYDTLNEAANVNEEGTSTNIFCTLILGIASTISSLVMFAHLLIAIDQHLAVVDSLHYHQRINEKVCNLLCFAMWTLGITTGILASVKFDGTDKEDANKDNHNRTQTNHTCHSCVYDENEIDIYQKSIISTITVISFLIPLVLLISIYGRIFFEAHQNSERTRRNSAASTTMETVRPNNRYFQYPIQYSGKHLDVSLMNLQGNTPSPSMKSNTSSLSQMASNMRRSVKYKMSHANAMVLYYGRIEEGRTAKITILILLTIVFCWTPYYTVITLNATKLAYVSENVVKFSLGCAFSNTILSPLLYAYRSSRVKRDIRRVFGNTFSWLGNNRLKRQQRQSFSANRLRRHKSFSCPHLLISDLSVPPHESNLKVKKENNSQISLLHKIKEFDGRSEQENESLNYRKISNPLQKDRRLSISLPKEMDRLPPPVFSRKMGVVARPCQADIFEQNENELFPMMEKYRQ